MLELAERPEIAVDRTASQNAALQRTAFYLKSRGEPLLAWLHTARDRHHGDQGVVICAPIGVEQLHSNRSLRHLADAIAMQGIPTLRFDWHGTGDSAGGDADPSRRATWHDNVRDAIGWMRTHLKCRRISVVGLRMGAMLAVEALANESLESLVLWAPVACGKTYMRQMRAIEQMAESRPRPPYAAAGDVEAAGFLITEETAEQITAANLFQLQTDCDRVLVVGPSDKRLVERLVQFGIPVDVIAPPGYAEMMAEPHASRVPLRAIREIAHWLGSQLVGSSVETQAVDANVAECTQARIVWRCPGAAPVCGEIRERLLRIGDVDLFGILSQPVETTCDAPTVLILNAGSASRVGPGRLYVDLARRLAGHGFPCLRLDIYGLGDSVCDSVDDENDPYPDTVFRDVALALQELRARFGTKRCVLLGLCSGAYAAFQSAVQLSDSSLVESILINPLTYYWRDGMTLDASAVSRQLKENWWIARATNVGKLWKFVRGKTEVGYVDAARVLWKRGTRYFRQLAMPALPLGAVQPISIVGHPTREDLPTDLSRIAAAGRRLSVFLAENDPGYVIMSYQARKQVRALQRSGVLSFSTISGGDHPFSRRAPREELLHAITDHLLSRYPAVD
jgi:pimeloyl-ACP methyl ester carboxylesterase